MLLITAIDDVCIPCWKIYVVFVYYKFKIWVLIYDGVDWHWSDMVIVVKEFSEWKMERWLCRSIYHSTVFLGFKLFAIILLFGFLNRVCSVLDS